MPKNLFQDIVFSVLMIIVMVFAMSCYNIAIQFGGLSNETFLMALECLWYMSLIALAVELIVVSPIVRKLTAKVLGKEKVHPFLITIVHSAITVCFMCFIMTFFATLIEKQPEASEFFVTWIQTMILSFPMALCWQIFVAGPLVRLIFRCIFVYPKNAKERKLAKNELVAVSAQSIENQNEIANINEIETQNEVANVESEEASLKDEKAETKVEEKSNGKNDETEQKANASSKKSKSTRNIKKI